MGTKDEQFLKHALKSACVILANKFTGTVVRFVHPLKHALKLLALELVLNNPLGIIVKSPQLEKQLEKLVTCRL